MTDRHEDWRERADRLNVRSPLLARATQANVHTVRAYRSRRFNPSQEWVERAERFLDVVERGVAA
jgi:hypothetical protein